MLGARLACLVNASVTVCGEDAIYAFGGFDQYTDEGVYIFGCVVVLFYFKVADLVQVFCLFDCWDVLPSLAQLLFVLLY